MKVRTQVSLFGLLLGSLVWGAPVVGQDEIVARGNLAYQEGDYAAAIAAYEAVSEAGFESAGLEYNLGNAYFKSGDLGRSILHWERALDRAPGDADTRANLELARSLTTDAIDPLPEFWLFTAVSWWVDLVPRGLLLLLVAIAWLCFAGGVATRVLARSEGVASLGYGLGVVGAVLVLVFGINLVVREVGLGRAERAVVMVEVVAVRSAPAADDDLTLFEIHEGTRVRIDERTGEWAEVVLDDGKVGWMPIAAVEII